MKTGYVYGSFPTHQDFQPRIKRANRKFQLWILVVTLGTLCFGAVLSTSTRTTLLTANERLSTNDLSTIAASLKTTSLEKAAPKSDSASASAAGNSIPNVLGCMQTNCMGVLQGAYKSGTPPSDAVNKCMNSFTGESQQQCLEENKSDPVAAANLNCGLCNGCYPGGKKPDDCTPFMKENWQFNVPSKKELSGYSQQTGSAKEKQAPPQQGGAWDYSSYMKDWGASSMAVSSSSPNTDLKDKSATAGANPGGYDYSDYMKYGQQGSGNFDYSKYLSGGGNGGGQSKNYFDYSKYVDPVGRLIAKSGGGGGGGGGGGKDMTQKDFSKMYKDEYAKEWIKKYQPPAAESTATPQDAAKSSEAATPAQPAAPESTEPVAPESTEPVAPESTEPVAPESTEPAAPESTKAAAPDDATKASGAPAQEVPPGEKAPAETTSKAAEKTSAAAKTAETAAPVKSSAAPVETTEATTTTRRRVPSKPPL